MDAAIWLSVEEDIGILSACLPTMGPLLHRAFSSSLRSYFSRLRNKRYSAGAERLPDHEVERPGLHVGQENKKHKMWYDQTGLFSWASKHEASGQGGGDGDDASDETMVVPMGRIRVRRDIELARV